MARSIAQAVVMKDLNVFFLTDADGQVPLEDGHGLGLYYHDCRFLNGYELKLAGIQPNVLVSTAARGFMAIFELSNARDIKIADGSVISKEDIGITWERVVDHAQLTLHDRITLKNFGLEQITFPLSLTFQPGFEDVFVVRRFLAEKPGTLHPPAWKDGILSFLYDGADGLYRRLAIHFAPTPKATDGTTAHFQITLQPRESKQILVSLDLAESTDRSAVQTHVHQQADLEQVETIIQRSADQWLGHYTRIRSDSVLLDKILERSFRDLGVLRSMIGDEQFFAAGIPWFATLFGRDSLITALQTLAYDPDIAEQTLRVLARHQGQHVDEWQDEQPGKILHELRIGELARLGEIPHTPYYGTVDATSLFLILVGRHAAWTGDLTVFNDLRSHIEHALEWMSQYGDREGDGYIEYESESTSEQGLINKGWKDSGNAIVNDDGSLAKPPIALVEVQGYAYLAKLTLADLYQRAGEPKRAAQLRHEAEELRARFNRDFWLEDKGFYALALQASNRPAAVLSSNPGHALWSGIADPDKARRTVEALMADDMYSGWGVRTLSTKERRYNPIGYHLGTVWPHDNSFIAAGFRRYGFDDAALRIFMGTLEATMYFDGYHLPELFAGFPREDYHVPVRYPVANHPQAWGAGTVPYLLETMLGLVPEAFEHCLRIVHPILPHFIDRVEVHRLQVGQAHA
ncbi:MAG: amylo-alpha-1,6-glucosidase, partial [Chloroflexota bacterium]|nr:amylo-alpha-1,6-glucosidase [Chloroflexota bacterium]